MERGRGYEVVLGSELRRGGGACRESSYSRRRFAAEETAEIGRHFPRYIIGAKLLRV